MKSPDRPTTRDDTRDDTRRLRWLFWLAILAQLISLLLQLWP